MGLLLHFKALYLIREELGYICEAECIWVKPKIGVILHKT